jgi:hypothetical protein
MTFNLPTTVEATQWDHFGDENIEFASKLN